MKIWPFFWPGKKRHLFCLLELPRPGLSLQSQLCIWTANHQPPRWHPQGNHWATCEQTLPWPVALFRVSCNEITCQRARTGTGVDAHTQRREEESCCGTSAAGKGTSVQGALTSDSERLHELASRKDKLLLPPFPVLGILNCMIYLRRTDSHDFSFSN